MLALRRRAKSGRSYYATVTLTAVDAVQLEQEVGLCPPGTVKKIQGTYKFAPMTPDLHVGELLYILSDSWTEHSDILHRGYMVEFETAWGKFCRLLFSTRTSVSPRWTHEPVPYCSNENVAWA